jgi:hypothetical protein
MLLLVVSLLLVLLLHVCALKYAECLQVCIPHTTERLSFELLSTQGRSNISATFLSTHSDTESSKIPINWVGFTREGIAVLRGVF